MTDKISVSVPTEFMITVTDSSNEKVLKKLVFSSKSDVKRYLKSEDVYFRKNGWKYTIIEK